MTWKGDSGFQFDLLEEIENILKNKTVVLKRPKKSGAKMTTSSTTINPQQRPTQLSFTVLDVEKKKQ